MYLLLSASSSADASRRKALREIGQNVVPDELHGLPGGGHRLEARNPWSVLGNMWWVTATPARARSSASWSISGPSVSYSPVRISAGGTFFASSGSKIGEASGS